MNYEYRCIHCARCCRGIIQVIIYEDDLRKLIQDEGSHIVHNLMLNPISFSPLKFEKMEEKQRLKVIDFILKNHEYSGEGDGFQIDRPFVKRNWGSRPILVPKTPEIILQGMDLDLEYILTHELHGQCPFLNGNFCTIQASKPKVCRQFPFDRENRLRVDDFVLSTCRGVQPVEL